MRPNAGWNRGQAGVRALPMPSTALTVTVGGQTVTPEYAGGAPGEIAGLMQINVHIPDNVASGAAVPITVGVPDDSTSQPSITIAVGK